MLPVKKGRGGREESTPICRVEKECKSLEKFFLFVFLSQKATMPRLSLLVALFVSCALSALSDASSATSAASSTAVLTLTPAGEVVELTVRGVEK